MSCILLLSLFARLNSQVPETDSLLQEKLLFLRTSLERDELNTRVWWNGWFYGYTVATLGQGVVWYTSDDKPLRQDMILGAATTFLGAANQFLTTLRPSSDVANFTLMPDGSFYSAGEKLLVGEQLLRERAEREKAARSWQTHALSGVVNLGSGLITWLGFKRTVWAGLGNFALNTAITEAQIWLQPMRAKRDYEKYCRSFLNGEPVPVTGPVAQWSIGVYPGGATIRLTF